MQHRRNTNRNVDEDTFRRVRDSNARACRQIFPIFLLHFISKPTLRVCFVQHFVADILLSTLSYSPRIAAICQYNDNLTNCGRVTQIRVFNTVKLGTSASSP